MVDVDGAEIVKDSGGFRDLRFRLIDSGPSVSLTTGCGGGTPGVLTTNGFFGNCSRGTEKVEGYFTF